MKTFRRCEGCCSRWATVERDGTPWCWQHDTTRPRLPQGARKAEAAEQRRRATCYPSLVEALRTLGMLGLQSARYSVDAEFAAAVDAALAAAEATP